MSGGHWEYVGFKIQEDLKFIAKDEEAVKRWPILMKLLGELADTIYAMEHEMDWDLSQDSIIKDDKGFEMKHAMAIFRSADAAVKKALF